MEPGEAIAIGLGAAAGGLGSAAYLAHHISRASTDDGLRASPGVRGAIWRGEAARTSEDAARAVELASALRAGTQAVGPLLYSYAGAALIAFAITVVALDGAVIVLAGILAVLFSATAAARVAAMGRLAAAQEANRQWSSVRATKTKGQEGEEKDGFTGQTRLLGIALGVVAIGSGISGLVGAPMALRIVFAAVLVAIAIALATALWQVRRQRATQP